MTAPTIPSEATSATPLVRWWPEAAAVILLATHVALSIDTLRQKSVTVDEVAHLPAGISYWHKGTFELYHHNPPLVKLLAALPALAAGAHVDYSQSWEWKHHRALPRSPWAFGWEFMYANAERYHEIYFWARLPVVALSVVAGTIMFLWARELFGPAAGVLAVALWSFCPNVIAHAGLVTTDMGASAIGFIATFFFWRYLREPTWRRAALAGTALGLAELAKFSSLLLYLIWPAIWILWAVFRSHANGQPQRSRVTPLLHAAAILSISLVVINLGYGFEGTGCRLRDFTFLSKLLTRPRQPADGLPRASPEHPWFAILIERQNRFAGTWLESLPVPLPRHFVEGFDEQKLEAEGIAGEGYPVYLCGELRRTGWWWYYGFALLVKVPLGTLVLSAIALIGFGQTFTRQSIANDLVLLIPSGATLFVMSFLTDINLGLRYVLPAFPFWMIFLSRLGQRISPRAYLWNATIALSVAWNLLACIRVHPNHLAYFNELVGGPKHGYKYLIDSNLDWGQDLLALERWLRENRPGERIGLVYFGNLDPSILAACGRPIAFVLGPPARLDLLRLVAARPDGPYSALRREWIESHAVELERWLKENQMKVSAVNEHPALRKLFFNQLDMREGPQPGLYAVSANMVCGLPFRVRDHAGNLWNAQQDAYSYFRKLTPVTQVGYSIFVYDVSPEQASALRAEMDFEPLSTGAGE